MNITKNYYQRQMPHRKKKEMETDWQSIHIKNMHNEHYTHTNISFKHLFKMN